MGVSGRWRRVFLRWFLRAFGAFCVSLLLYLFVIRPWHLHWGATAEEVARTMPGDDLISGPGLDTTRAITIRARPEEIWPWLVQMGYGRGGWYSYDRLDNSGRRSADKIIPEFQTPLVAGGRIPGGQRYSFQVMSMETNRSLVLGPQISWSFGLYPQADGSTRLVERLRAKYHWRRPRMYPFIVMLDVGDFIMMRKHLLSLKQRVEANTAPKAARKS